jgi:hypothetical protein
MTCLIEAREVRERYRTRARAWGNQAAHYSVRRRGGYLRFAEKEPEERLCEKSIKRQLGYLPGISAHRRLLAADRTSTRSFSPLGKIWKVSTLTPVGEISGLSPTQGNAFFGLSGGGFRDSQRPKNAN